MFVKKQKGPVSVSLADGSKLCRSDLPAAGTRRWVAKRKARVVAAVASGLLEVEEACSLYDLSAEELEEWMRLAGSHGVAGLKSTFLQQYRQL